VLKNRDMDFKTDPNGFVIPTPRQAKAEVDAAAAERAAAAAALEHSTSSLGDRLRAAAGVAEAPAVAAQAAAAPTMTVPTDPVMANFKAEFLKKFGATYGYGGRIDELYPKEVLLERVLRVGGGRVVVGGGWQGRSKRTAH
jgi:hypothetical protein